MVARAEALGCEVVRTCGERVSLILVGAHICMRVAVGAERLVRS
jgi:hypothetical protein